MKFHFDDQPHQAQAIEAVTDLFTGALQPPASALAGQAAGSDGHSGFQLNLSGLIDNLKLVATRENVNVPVELDLREETDLLDQTRSFPNFSVEMETGTGKTYVYIATALRLAEAYGLRKFVILVHSVAIRAGVAKTFAQTREHFRNKFPGLTYQWNVLGDTKALHDFADPSSTVQFLITSVQLLDKPSTNTLYALPEQPRIWGESMSGMQQVAQLRPVVMIDEPQNMHSPLRRKAIATLNPLFALRYSATHKDPYNLVHRLSAKKAAEAGLVKRVSVKGIVAGSDGAPYIHLKSVTAKKVKGTTKLLAELTFDKSEKSGSERVSLTLQPGSNLFEDSGELTQYRGYAIEKITRNPDCVEFSNGKRLLVGEETGVDALSIWRDQVRQTIRFHLRKQVEIDKLNVGVKVLSLFFVEHVADYIGEAAPLPAMFDAIFVEEWQRTGNSVASMPDPATLRVHYFPSTKTGIYKDTKGGRATDAEFEARAYEEIITHKELILDRDNPRAFIFSHSALREGWDNPNVFQIGFLRHTKSDTERRQQIGRGLRLPVDKNGNRVMDPAINRLTLVVDESFKEFKDGLNAEYSGNGLAGGSGPDVDNEDDFVEIQRRVARFSSPEFEELWKRIRYKAVYRIEVVDSKALTQAVAEAEYLENLSDIQRRANTVQSADLIYDDAGKVVTSDESVAESAGERILLCGQKLPNVVQLVEDQLIYGKFPLQLTRPTVVGILKAIPDKYHAAALHEPDRWARIVSHAIRVVVIEQMVQNITYEPMDEAEWWDASVIFLEIERKPAPKLEAGKPPKSGVVAAPSDGRNLFDHVDYDSLVEKTFAELLENSSEHVKLFTKLPRRFKVKTPVGEYSPDWAIVWEEGGVERLYLVRETKDTLDLNNLEWDEAMRIRFAEKHFASAPNGTVNYTHTTAATVRVTRPIEAS